MILQDRFTARLAGRIILLDGWRRALVAFLSGAAAVLAQAPFDFFAACFVAFPVLVWLLDGAVGDPGAGVLKRALPAFATGWWFGFGYFLAGLWWIGSALLVDAESFAWALPLAVLVLPALLAGFYGAAAVLARTMWSDDLGRIASLAFAFGAVEWLRSWLFTGFPWNPLGFAAMPVPVMMQSVSVVGTTGMNALAVFVFAMPAMLSSARGRRLGLGLALVLALAHVGFGYWRLSQPAADTGRVLSVRIVQPAIDQAEKWDRAVRDRVFRTLRDLSTQPAANGAVPRLVLWPETSLPFLLTQEPDALSALADMLSPEQTLLMGAVRAEVTDPVNPAQSARYYNSVVQVAESGEIVDAVDKIHLVPFGEYLPLGDFLERLGFQKVVALPLDFSAGASRHALSIDGVRAVPFVCYEVIFPSLVLADAAGADVIVNVTNDAWFGTTTGPYQHFRQAQIRAVESGRPLLRAANTGISGVVDAKGRVVDALALNTRGVLDAVVPVAVEQIAVRSNFIGSVVIGVVALLGCGLSVRERVRSN